MPGGIQAVHVRHIPVKVAGADAVHHRPVREVDDEIAFMASGATAYLTKPFRPRQLTEVDNQLCPAGPLTAHRQDHRP